MRKPGTRAADYLLPDGARRTQRAARANSEAAAVGLYEAADTGDSSQFRGAECGGYECRLGHQERAGRISPSHRRRVNSGPECDETP